MNYERQIEIMIMNDLFNNNHSLNRYTDAEITVKVAKHVIKINENDPKLIEIYNVLNKLEIDTEDIENLFELWVFFSNLPIVMGMKNESDPLFFLAHLEEINKLISLYDELCKYYMYKYFGKEKDNESNI